MAKQNVRKFTLHMYISDDIFVIFVKRNNIFLGLESGGNLTPLDSSSEVSQRLEGLSGWSGGHQII